jgi:UDP-glucose 4-epimerase
VSNVKVIVTGGAGFIGSRVVKFLSDVGYEVHIIDNLFTGVGKPETSDLVNFYELDVCSRSGL